MANSTQQDQGRLQTIQDPEADALRRHLAGSKGDYRSEIRNERQRVQNEIAQLVRDKASAAAKRDRDRG